MPEITDEFKAADEAPTAADAPETTAEEDFGSDPAEVAPNGQKAAQGASDAEDGPTAAEIESVAQAKAAAIAQAEKEIAEKVAAEKAKAPEPDAEFGPKVHDPVIETQDHPDHPSRHRPAGRPCPAGPQN